MTFKGEVQLLDRGQWKSYFNYIIRFGFATALCIIWSHPYADVIWSCSTATWRRKEKKGDSYGAGLNQSAASEGIFIRSNGDVYIANTLKRRVVKWKQNILKDTALIDYERIFRNTSLVLSDIIIEKESTMLVVQKITAESNIQRVTRWQNGSLVVCWDNHFLQ